MPRALRTECVRLIDVGGDVLRRPHRGCRCKHTFLCAIPRFYGAASAAQSPTFLDFELVQLTDPSVCVLVTSTE